MPLPEPSFVPSPDVRVILNALINILERRPTRQLIPGEELRSPRSIKVAVGELDLPGYGSQVDPEPRQVSNEQLLRLENAGVLRLRWQPGEKDYLLESIALVCEAAAPLYTLLGRTPTTNLRARLESQLLGNRFRFGEQGWQHRAIRHVLDQIKENKSPAPFTLNDPGFNEDLLTALVALSDLKEETAFRVFSVHAFNDSKRFEDLRKAMVRLARIDNRLWKHLPENELLRELNLVPNPTYLLLAGPWTLVDAAGQVLSLGEFRPSVGIPSIQAMHLERATVHADQVLCIENLTSFHAIAASLASGSRSQNTALICLSGNPSPACRRLLTCLSNVLPEPIPLYIWADMDYGGFNIVSQLRREVNPRFLPYHMDIDTLDHFKQFARPLTVSDRRNLERQIYRNELSDLRPVMVELLKRGLKLEQEAIKFEGTIG